MTADGLPPEVLAYLNGVHNDSSVLDLIPPRTPEQITELLALDRQLTAGLLDALSAAPGEKPGKATTTQQNGSNDDDDD